MSDPLMLAMSQSGIIENNFPFSHQIVPVKNVKIIQPSYILPKRIIQTPTYALPQRIFQARNYVLPQRIRLAGKCKEESVVSPTIISLKRPGIGPPGELQGNPKKLKVAMNNNQGTLAQFGMMDPVLSQIFGGRFDSSVAFNVQV